MKILIAHNAKIPAHAYGGSERIIWWLGKNLAGQGHRVVYLVKKGSACPFAEVLFLDEKKSLDEQIPADVDLVHLHFEPTAAIQKPTLITCHENARSAKTFHPNTVFLSANHAQRHGGKVFVHNGLDFEDYGSPMLNNRRLYLHFLGNAAWRVKNLPGAMSVASEAGENLHVIGGTRVNFRSGLRITLNPRIRFHGMLTGLGKNAILNNSKGLVFPAIWHEPFGLATIESLYFGCPVFGTPYGSLPELLGRRAPTNGKKSWNGTVDAYFSDYGSLSVRKSELVEAVKNWESFDRKRCHEYVVDNFSAARMTGDYLKLYEKILAGEALHDLPPAMDVEPPSGYLPFS